MCRVTQTCTVFCGSMPPCRRLGGSSFLALQFMIPYPILLLDSCFLGTRTRHYTKTVPGEDLPKQGFSTNTPVTRPGCFLRRVGAICLVPMTRPRADLAHDYATTTGSRRCLFPRRFCSRRQGPISTASTPQRMRP